MSRTSHKLRIASEHALIEKFEIFDDNQMQSDGKVACKPSAFRIGIQQMAREFTKE